MREQGSLKGEGTHRGNLFVDNSEQNLAGRYGCFWQVGMAEGGGHA